MFAVPKTQCQDIDQAVRKEWLETNGLGGYASSTIANCHTRKYHGLLVASLKEPRGKFVLLSKLEPSILIGDQESSLSTNKYPGVYHPDGYKRLEQFQAGLYPSATYRVGEALIRESYMMIQGQNTVLILYELLKGRLRPTLRLRPRVAFRDIHALGRETLALHPKSYPEKNGRKVQPFDGMPPLYMGTNIKSEFFPGPKWIYNVEYLCERERGFDYQEDLFCPGMFEVQLSKATPVVFAASTEPLGNLKMLWNKELHRRESRLEECKGSCKAVKWLQFFGDQFLIRNASDFASVVAGYHWFGEWGRDTMIALPGLTFHSGHHKFGEEVLIAYAGLEKNGLLPNYLDQRSDHLAYNSVDASLWFFWAVQEYLHTGGSKQTTMKHLYPALRSIIEAHLNGRVPLCGVGENGLLYAGNEHTQLTWMDAQAYGKPVTPRHGAAVEINALWYNALRFFLELAPEEDDLSQTAAHAVSAMEANFMPRFWNHTNHCLCDVTDGGGQDCRIRPNQIFAASLPYTLMDQEHLRVMVRTVTDHLATPYGLRTLTPEAQEYTPSYDGDADQRDSAYHQGLVWPWLTGHFGQAYLRQAEDKSKAKKFLRTFFSPILRSFPDQHGLTSIAEIYTGNEPHRPDGTIAQAWSVAEAIRLNKLLEER